MFCSKCGANVPAGVAFCSACGQPVPSTAAIPAISPTPAQAGRQQRVPQSTIAYAGFWLRFVAFIVDAIILAVVGGIVTLPFMAAMGLRGISMGRFPASPIDLIPLMGSLIRVVLIRLILHWLYFALFESSSWQGTIGKKALGLEVTDIAGNRISFGRASGRFFGKIISSLILFIGFILAGLTEKKQALHDMLADTLVIRKL